MLSIHYTNDFKADELKDLFSSVHWGESLSQNELYEAILNSTHCVTARIDGKLVGLARSMDDDIWSANIDCIVVHKAYQHQGIGTAMLHSLLKTLSHIKFISAMPNSSKNTSLYLNCGFQLVEDSRFLQLSNK